MYIANNYCLRRGREVYKVCKGQAHESVGRKFISPWPKTRKLSLIVIHSSHLYTVTSSFFLETAKC
jgi:hypothetical protein